ncbi:MAG TPA: hypothetical protein VJ644_09480, partial [Jiangellaceae bacterium]|nr:hypothetical protein [Jiangellaceae bacterium]
CETGTLPAGHGVRPHLAVIITLDSLHATAGDRRGDAGGGLGGGGTAPGELGWGGPISAAAVRRIGCDAG